MNISPTRISMSAFLLTLLLFFLPFVTLACPGGEFQFSGMQLVAGTTVDEPQPFGPPKQQKLDGEPLALLALACAVAGVVVCLIRIRQLRIAVAALGGAGFLFLLLLEQKLDADILRQGSGLVEVRHDAGYWLALLSFAAAGGTALFLGKPVPGPQVAAAPPASGPSEAGNSVGVT